tara:strand:- start:8273 stop:9148 length:876 start_codon:yes stop_codon:yes gene_type:complete
MQNKSKNFNKCLSKMRRLQQLLQSRIVFCGDVLYFTFKKHLFTGKVAQGGLIWQCTWQKPGEHTQPIFNTDTVARQEPYVRTFESLTDWTETCIQECLDEYHTRYSSWKRVRHQRSDQPMEILFKHLQRRKLTNEHSAVNNNRDVLLFEQIASQKYGIETLQKQIDAWSRWFKEKFPGQDLPVSAPEEARTEQASAQPAAQPFVLNSDRGQYMVLHRLNEVAPDECVSWLKKNGPESFKEMLGNVKQPITFMPATAGTDTWSPVDEETSRRFVHSFFNSSGSAASLSGTLS